MFAKVIKLDNMKTILKNFLYSVLAGLAIGLGGFLFIFFTYAINGEFGKILGSLFFAVGLFTVCACKLFLYTGKIGNVYEGKQDKLFYVSLPIGLVGNAIGAVGLGYLAGLIFDGTKLETRALNVALSRLVFDGIDNYLMCIVKAILCGLCVFIAVKAFNLNRMKPLGIIMLVLFVFIFVYCGFEHCIANMFYFGFANSFAKETANTFIDLALVILGNSLGAGLGVLLFKSFTLNGK